MHPFRGIWTQKNGPGGTGSILHTMQDRARATTPSPLGDWPTVLGDQPTVLGDPTVREYTKKVIYNSEIHEASEVRGCETHELRIARYTKLAKSSFSTKGYFSRSCVFTIKNTDHTIKRTCCMKLLSSSHWVAGVFVIPIASNSRVSGSCSCRWRITQKQSCTAKSSAQKCPSSSGLGGGEGEVASLASKSLASSGLKHRV